MREQWVAFDIDLTSISTYKNPFLDVDVVAEFYGPNSETVRIIGFWDGGSAWKVRFAPTRVGAWSYKINSTNPDDTGLEDSGEFECVAYTGDHDIYKNGFLKVGPQGRYLIYNNGIPFYWLGDTHWTFITEEKFDESNHPKYKSQFKACVDKRVDQKFTVYQSNFREGVRFGEFGRYVPFFKDTEAGLLPDIEFFKENPDKKMKYIADAGLVNAVGLSWAGAILSGGLERYKLAAKYFTARYGAYPVIWTLGGEIPGYAPDKEQILTDLWREVALELEKYSAYHNLQSVHLATNRPFPGVYQGEKWYDFAMSQAGHGDFDMNYTMYSIYREKYPMCPLVESEGLYEGAISSEFNARVITPAMFRRLAYLNMQNGGCGYTYGCNGVWELQWEAGKGGIGWGDMAWWDGLELPGADQLTIMRDFYESVDWSTLRPINFCLDRRATVNEQLDWRGQACFTANDDMSTVVGYFSETTGRSFTINTLTWDSYTVKWFNPETGEYTMVDEDARPAGGVWSLQGTRRITGGGDSVLVMIANGN